MRYKLQLGETKRILFTASILVSILRQNGKYSKKYFFGAKCSSLAQSGPKLAKKDNKINDLYDDFLDQSIQNDI